MVKNVHTFLGCESEYNDSSIVIFGAPFDSTTSFRPGARFAPAVMRNESYALETFSPCLDRDLCDIRVFDGGDLDLVFGDAQRSLDMIRKTAADALGHGKIPFMLGGEHLVTLGAVRAAHELYADNLRIVHFDAHADLRGDYLGNVLSHATVIRRCHDLVGDGKIFQFGIRSGERDEFIFANEHINTNKFNFSGIDKLAGIIGDEPIYLTIDLDVLDPSVFCGTGTPEHGGVSFMELHNAMLEVCKLNIIGADLVELAPNLDTSGASTAAALKVMRELLLMLG